MMIVHNIRISDTPTTVMPFYSIGAQFRDSALKYSV